MDEVEGQAEAPPEGASACVDANASSKEETNILRRKTCHTTWLMKPSEEAKTETSPPESVLDKEASSDGKPDIICRRKTSATGSMTDSDVDVGPIESAVGGAEEETLRVSQISEGEIAEEETAGNGAEEEAVGNKEAGKAASAHTEASEPQKLQHHPKIDEDGLIRGPCAPSIAPFHDEIGASSSHKARNVSAMSQFSISDSWGGELGALPAFAMGKIKRWTLTSVGSGEDEMDEELLSGESLHSSRGKNGRSALRSPPLRWYCFVVFYLLQSVGSLLFLRWLLTGAWNAESPTASALYFCAEVIAFVSSSLSLFTGLFWQREGQPADAPQLLTDESDRPHVAVCLCRYKEPLEDLFITLECILDIDYPSDKLHVYILDDGFYCQDIERQETQMQELAHFVPGAHKLHSDALSAFKTQREKDLYRTDCAVSSHHWNIRSLNSAEKRCEVTLIARKAPRTSHYKAGNLNNFLYNYLGQKAAKEDVATNAPNAVFLRQVLLLDHDMMPSPAVLNEAVPRFEREDLAFVQYPQRFWDVVTEDRFCAGNEIFFDGVCEARSHVGLAAFAGTNAVWRLSALYAVGGMQLGSVTEDANTGFSAHRKGYTSEYVPKDLCVGQSPQNLPDAMRQRMRWSQGSIEMIMQFIGSLCARRSNAFPCPQVLAAKHNLPSKSPNLSGGQRIILALVYAESLIYPFYAFGFLLHVCVCLLYLVNAQSPMAPSDPLHILLYWLPLYVVKTACQHLAFPLVSLRAFLGAQRAWAGYALSTVWSILQAFGLGSSGWFNTGGTRKDRFLLQYGNTTMFMFMAAAMIYRAVAFTFWEDSCDAWMTVGALVYSLIFCCLLKEWALMSFASTSVKSNEVAARREESVPVEITTGDSDNKSKQQSSSFSLAMRDSVRTKASRIKAKADDDSVGSSSVNSFASLLSGVESGAESEISRIRSNYVETRIRDMIRQREAYERHSPNLSVLVNFASILIITSVIFVWSVQLNDSSRWSQC